MLRKFKAQRRRQKAAQWQYPITLKCTELKEKSTTPNGDGAKEQKGALKENKSAKQQQEKLSENKPQH